MDLPSDSRPPSRARRLLRRGLIAGGIGLALLGAAIAGAIAYSQTAAFRDWLRLQVVAAANDALAGELQIGRIDGTLFGSLHITDVRVTLDGDSLLTLDSLDARYDLLALLTHRRLALTRVALDGFRLRLVDDERGWNVARLLPAAEEEEAAAAGTPAVAVRLDDLTLRNGVVDVVLPDARYAVHDLAFDAGADLDGTGQRVRLQKLSAALPDRDLHIAMLAGQFDLESDGAVSVEDLVLQTGASSLRANARVDAAGDGYDVHVAIDHLSAAEIHRLTGSSLPASDLSLTLHARGPAHAVSLDGSELTGAAGAVRVGGLVDLRDAAYGYDVRVTLDTLDIARLLGPAQPTTQLHGVLAATGSGLTADAAAAAFTVALDGSTIADTRVERLELTGSIAGGRVDIDAAATTAAGSATLGGMVHLGSEEYDLRLGTAGFDPTVFAADLGMPVQLDATAHVSGSGFTPHSARAGLRLTVGPSRVGTIDVRSLDAVLHLADARLTIERLALESSVATAEVAGSIGLHNALGHTAAAADEGDVRYSVRVTDLHPLAALTGNPDVQGTLHLHGTAAGRLDALAVHATLEATQLRAGDVRAGTLHAVVQAAGLGAPQGTAAPPTTAALTVDVADMDAAGRRFAGASLQADWRHDSAKPPSATAALRVREDDTHEHSVRASAVLDGDTHRLRIEHLAVQLGGDTWQTAGVADVVHRSGRVAVSGFDLRSARGEIAIAGDAGTSGIQDLTVTVRDLDLEPWVPAEYGGVRGRLSAHARLAGTARAPRLDAEIAIDDARLGDVHFEAVRTACRIGEGVATLDARLVQAGTNALQVAARLPLDVALDPVRVELGDQLAGTLRAAQIDLAFLDPLVPDVSGLRGILDADVSLSGSLHAPDIRGPVSITAGRAAIVATGVTYEPIELRARLDGPSITLDHLRIASGTGALTGAGSARRDGGVVSGDVTIDLADFPFLDNRQGEGVASGQIRIGGSSAAPVIEGKIETTRLVLRIPEQLPGAVRPPDPTITIIGLVTGDGPVADAPLASPDVPLDPADDDAAAEATPAIVDAARIRLDIRVPRNAWVRRSDTEIELRGAIRATKRPQRGLRVSGEINTVRGWYTFQGKKFTVSEGQVTLSGQDFDPLLNVVATHRAGEYTVRIRIDGRVSAPAISLESDPVLEQADILSVLLFGKPADQLNQGESRGLREQALSVSSGYLASEFRQSVADALGVDTLEIEPGADGFGSGSASVGKYLRDDIFVTLSHKFAQHSIQQLTVQYFLTRRWTIETAADTRGDSSIDLFWQRRY